MNRPSDEVLAKVAADLAAACVQSGIDAKVATTGYGHHVEVNGRRVASVDAHHRRGSGRYGLGGFTTGAVQIQTESVSGADWRTGVALRAVNFNLGDGPEFKVPARCVERIAEIVAEYDSRRRAQDEAYERAKALKAETKAAAAIDPRITVPKLGRVAVALECDAAEVGRLVSALAAFGAWKAS